MYTQWNTHFQTISNQTKTKRDPTTSDKFYFPKLHFQLRWEWPVEAHLQCQATGDPFLKSRHIGLVNIFFSFVLPCKKNNSNFSGRLHFQSLELDGSLHMERRFHIQWTKRSFSLSSALPLADEVIGLDTEIFTCCCQIPHAEDAQCWCSVDEGAEIRGVLEVKHLGSWEESTDISSCLIEPLTPTSK